VRVLRITFGMQPAYSRDTGQRPQRFGVMGVTWRNEEARER
jgi:hypothetical protein